jgi:hypothetical protein
MALYRCFACFLILSQSFSIQLLSKALPIEVLTVSTRQVPDNVGCIVFKKPTAILGIPDIEGFAKEIV